MCIYIYIHIWIVLIGELGYLHICHGSLYFANEIVKNV